MCRRFRHQRSPSTLIARTEPAERNLAYVANPANRLAWGYQETPRPQISFARTERRTCRATGATNRQQHARCGAPVGRHSCRRGDRPRRPEDGPCLTVRYQIRTCQERSPLRRGDKLTLLDGRPFIFVVVTTALDAHGHTVVSLEVKDGKTKPGQPAIGEAVELAEPLGPGESIGRTMALAHQRLRTKPTPRAVAGTVRSTHDYLSSVQALRRTK